MTTLAPFEIHRATSVAEAAGLLHELGDDAVLYAGGSELLLVMKLGFARYGHLVDIKPIAELGVLDVQDETLRIGATVSHHTLQASSLVRDGWPDLAEMELWVANVRVRTTGTLGGNLAFADPHSDPATFLLAADARALLGRGDGQRRMGIDELILGAYETALEPDELLLGVEVPAVSPGAAMAHLRFKSHERPAATVSALVQVTEGRVRAARLAVGSVGIRAVLVEGVEAALVGQAANDLDGEVIASLGRAAADAAEPVADSNGSADFKAALVATLVRRAVTEAVRRATERSASEQSHTG
jgi:carbon-monoxide dehydrogenase medium subunit